jgi:predicted secreted protein
VKKVYDVGVGGKCEWRISAVASGDRHEALSLQNLTTETGNERFTIRSPRGG